MKDKIIANNKQFVVQKGYVNNLTDKYLERRQESDDTTSGTQFIDLGLPSGTLWADRNIGANDPEDYGEYFRWGETTPFYEDSYVYDYLDLGDNIAGTEYDVATAILGKDYKMPTDEQLKELLHCCSWERTAINDVKGMKVTGPNGNNIFLPAAGFCYNNSCRLAATGTGGYYWTSSHDSLLCEVYEGSFLMFDSLLCSWAKINRGTGLSVRPVLTLKQVSDTK